MDSVLESTRAAEAAVKKQTREQLDAFRRQQEEAEQAARGPVEPEAPPTTESWAVSRKRKKGREDALGGLKLRKASSGAKAMPESSTEQVKASEKTAVDPASAPPASPTETLPKTAPVEDKAKALVNAKDAPKPSTSPPPSLGLALAAYSSDEDD